MSFEQEQQLQFLDTEIQIAEKQLRIATIRKQIVETELDVASLHHELRSRIVDRDQLSLSGFFDHRKMPDSVSRS
jgi:predicted ester cyclase